MSKHDTDKLERYREMRDFERTDEPAGGEASPSGRAFVIQKHDARRLHYDFRLELDGVLKSWAVPKGPSLSPKDKRLAVETEDHPLDYRDFEGVIPEGEYGGGPVIVWDRGQWEPIGDPHAGLAKGHLDFVVHGQKLHGKFMLLRLARREREKKNSWLLVKRSDEHVRSGKAAEIVSRLPRSVVTDRTIADVERGVPATRERAAKLPPFGKTAPELATLVDTVPTGDEWIYELKYDGYRILATLDDGTVRLASRNGKDWTKTFPEVARALSHVRARTALFDGEIAAVAADGRTDFQALQNALSGSDRSRLVYFVFDLLHLDGVDLTSEPLGARKDKLRGVLAGEKPPLKMSEDVTESGPVFFEKACALGLEGIIAKRVDRPYTSGRGRDWVKIKCQKRQELIIAGYTPPKNGGAGIGALVLAVREGTKLRYAGKVGTGFTHASLVDLRKRLEPLAIDAPAVERAPKIRDATWVEPKLVCEVRFTEWTRDGALRHPSFQGLREDKTPREVVREIPKGAKATAGGVVITHPERVIDPESGLTKADLARYWGAIAPRFLPYATKRPIMLFRCPDGNASPTKCFFQKHHGRGLVDDVGTATIEGKEVLYVAKEKGLFHLVQLNALELHGWDCASPRRDRPDWVVFDFDPDEAVAFTRVIDAAKQLREHLKSLSLESFVKTTGGKGLHVVVPIKRAYGWDEVTTFSADVVAAIVAEAPNELVASMSKARRKNKIFVDRFRNARGATAVMPWSPRARAGLTVATPVAWTDLGHVDPRELTIASVPAVVGRRRKDPWEDLLSLDQSLPRRSRER